MPKRFIPLAMFSAILATTACGSSMKTPDIKKNPHPVHRHEINVTIEGAPDTLISVRVDSLFQIKNLECVPLQPGSGAHVAPDGNEVIQLSRNGSIFKGVFYADQLMDEDYYGLGVCHWSLSSVNVSLEGKRLLVSSLDWHDIETSHAKTIYFRTDSLADSVSHNITDTGTVLNDYVRKHRDEFFSVTLSSREEKK